MGIVKEGAKASSIFLVVALVIMLLGGIIGGVSWIAGVATSGIKGQGDAIKINNSAENWTGKQAWFEDKYHGIQGYDRQITVNAAQVKANPKDRTAADILNGVTSACITAVSEYNAESRKFLSQDWKSIDLPATITESDPTTDCK